MKGNNVGGSVQKQAKYRLRTIGHSMKTYKNLTLYHVACWVSLNVVKLQVVHEIKVTEVKKVILWYIDTV